MANAMIQPFIGKNLAAVLTPQSVATDGTLTDAAIGAINFAARLDPSDWSIDLITENVSATSVHNSNPVPNEQGGTFNLTEIIYAFPSISSTAAGFGTSNALGAASRTSNYHKLVLTLLNNAATPGTIEAMTAYVLMTNPRKFSYGKGKSTNQSSFALIALFDSVTGLELPNPSFSPALA